MVNPDQQRIKEHYGKVAVVMGGWSAEREVSLMSGGEVLLALQHEGVDAYKVDADRDVVNRLIEEKYDRVFLILHGTGGEDGQIQGALQMHQIPYSGSGVLGSALAMDKYKSKQVCAQVGIKTPEYCIVESFAQCKVGVNQIGFPVVLKPVFEGSSIGVSIVNSAEELEDAFYQAAEFGPVMAEAFMSGIEVTAGILNHEVLPLISMSTERQFYDYQAKYFDDDTSYSCPSGLSQTAEIKIKAAALKAFDVLGASGWGRVDFMLDSFDEAHFIELNTAPGMTKHSLVPMAARHQNISFEKLCLSILDSSFKVRK